MDIEIEYTRILGQFRLLRWNSFIGQLVHLVEGKGMGDGVMGLDEGYRYLSPQRVFTLLENMKTWCNIQVIIYPLLSGLLGCDYPSSLELKETQLSSGYSHVIFHNQGK